MDFDIDVDYNGTFVSDMTSQIADLAAVAPFLDSSNSSIYFGTASATDRFNDLLVDPTEAVDNDNEGIFDDVDLDPITFSNDFSNGGTSGTIITRGDQVVTVVLGGSRTLAKEQERSPMC